MRCQRDQQRCKAKLFQFLTYTHLSLCPYSSEKLCDCSSTRTMTEAMQGQKEEETCCSGRYKASQICYSQGKERYYTGVRKKPQNKVCLERYKHSNHKKPHQLLLAAINHYKHLSNSLFTAAVSGECLFFQFLLFIAPRKKKKKISKNNTTFFSNLLSFSSYFQLENFSVAIFDRDSHFFKNISTFAL